MNANELYIELEGKAAKAGRAAEFDALASNQNRYMGNKPSHLFTLRQYAAYKSVGPYADASEATKRGAVNELITVLNE